MVSNGFPNVTTSGQHYNIGEKPSVILYTHINLHAGTPKQQILFICLGVPDYSSSSSNMVFYGLREVKKNFTNISI